MIYVYTYYKFKPFLAPFSDQAYVTLERRSLQVVKSVRTAYDHRVARANIVLISYTGATGVKDAVSLENVL